MILISYFKWQSGRIDLAASHSERKIATGRDAGIPVSAETEERYINARQCKAVKYEKCLL
jgi:hypothetical protein